MINTNNPKELPKILIFPDTSARILVYVVKPLFEYFYRRYHFRPPVIVFVRTPQQGIEPTSQELDLLTERLQEIKNKFHLQKEDKVLIIDDVYYEGMTFKLISESINKTEPNLNIDGFFFIKYSRKLPENCYYGFSKRGYNFDFYLYGEYYIGVNKRESGKYVKKISTPWLIAPLRKALLSIGQEFVNSLERENSA